MSPTVSVGFCFRVVARRVLEGNLAKPCAPAVGGFTEAMKVAGWCEAHYIDLMPHNPLGPVSTAACIHLGAAVPNFAYLEDNFSVETMHSQWDSKVSTLLNQAGRTFVGLCLQDSLRFVRNRYFPNY